MGKQSLGEFELMVMLAVMQLGEDEAHPLAIVDSIWERAGRRVQRAAVHVTLQRLEHKGLVTTWLSAPRPERAGKGRRQVKLTRAGATAVSEARSALEGMWAGLTPTGSHK